MEETTKKAKQTPYTILRKQEIPGQEVWVVIGESPGKSKREAVLFLTESLAAEEETASKASGCYKAVPSRSWEEEVEVSWTLKPTIG